MIITLADIRVTFVRLTAGYMTVTWHTTRETVVAERTLVTTLTSIAFRTSTLTTDHITLAGQ